MRCDVGKVEEGAGGVRLHVTRPSRRPQLQVVQGLPATDSYMSNVLRQVRCTEQFKAEMAVRAGRAGRWAVPAAAGFRRVKSPS